MDQQVVHYSLAWDPNARQGFARIVLQGASTPLDVPVHSPADLAAVASVLRESPVFLRVDGLLYTGWEPVADKLSP